MPVSSVVLLVPGDLETRTGGYGYDREIVGGLRGRGWRVDVCTLDRSFPFPTDRARAHATEALARLPDDTLVLADGLAFGAMAEEAERESRRLRLVGLVHHPLALEHGLDARQAQAFVHSETRALGTTRGVVVTSPATGRSLASYGVPAERIAVVPPGTDPAPVSRGTRGIDPTAPDVPVELLIVATLTPRKGHDVLLEALARLPASLRWHLTCGGSAHMSPSTADALAARTARLGLADRVSFVGDLDASALVAAYDRADLFVLPTRHEGYGMVVAEAVARGLPVVATPTGAIPDLVDERSGVLVPIDDVPALTAALHATIAGDETRARLAMGARRRRETLTRWADSVAAMETALVRLGGDALV